LVAVSVDEILGKYSTTYQKL